MGYVGFAVPYSFAITALIRGRLEAAYLKQWRPFIIAAWCFLTLGITLGSWWSYRVLGWGGWWFWDVILCLDGDFVLEQDNFVPNSKKLVGQILKGKRRDLFDALFIT
jgi:hypothetical protein